MRSLIILVALVLQQSVFPVLNPAAFAAPLVLCPLANDLDADPATLTIRFAPTRGAAVVTNNGCIVYTPDPVLSNTVDSLTYRVCQFGNAANCKEISVAIHIGGTSTSFANEDFYVLPAWTSGSQPVYTHDVVANDLNVDAATLSGVFAPLNGTATVVGGQLQFRPAVGFTGYADSLLAVNGLGGSVHTFTVRWYIGDPGRFEVHQDRVWFPALDSDNDGLPDHGELEYASDLTTLTANGDPDGDGMDNRAEFAAGTNPIDAASFARISAMVFERSNQRFRLTVESGGNGRFHTLYREDDLSGAPWTTATGSTGSQSLYHVPSGASADQQFFRVRIMAPQ